MKVKYTNSESDIIYTEFSKECNKCIENCKNNSVKIICELDKKLKRIGGKDNTNGSVFICSDSSDEVKSSKVFKKIVDVLISGVEEIEKRKLFLNLETKKLTHNLTKINAHNIQELYAVVPQEILTKNLSSQLEVISEIISKNPDEAARMFLRIAKNNATIKTEFSVFNKVFGGITTIARRRHKIRNVTLNLYHTFFLEFKERNISFYFEDNEDYIFIDYESIHSVLYHIMDNASKYTLSGSIINVKFEKTIDYFSIIYDSISLRIFDNEIKKIFEEGISGRYAKDTQKEGSGLGLWQINKILELNDGHLEIKKNIKPSLSKKINNYWYDNNIFEIKLKNYAQHHL